MPATRHTAFYRIAALLTIIPLFAFVQVSGEGDPAEPAGSEEPSLRNPAGDGDTGSLDDSRPDDDPDDDPDDEPDDDPDNDSNGQPDPGFDFSPDDVHYDEHGVLHASEEVLIKLREYLV